MSRKLLGGNREQLVISKTILKEGLPLNFIPIEFKDLPTEKL
jgi:hypothetical protein